MKIRTMKLGCLMLSSAVSSMMFAASAGAQMITSGSYTTAAYGPGNTVYGTPQLVVDFDDASVVAWRSWFAGTPPGTSGGTVKAGTLGVIGDPVVTWYNGFQSDVANSIVFDWTGGAAGIAGWNASFATATNNSALGSGFWGSAGYPLSYQIAPGAVGSYEYRQYGYSSLSGGDLPMDPGYTKLELYSSSDVLLSTLIVDVPTPTTLGYTDWGYSLFSFEITDPTQYLVITYEVANSTSAFKGLYGASLSAVPEPSVYGFIAMALLGGLIWKVRRTIGKRAAV